MDLLSIGALIAAVISQESSGDPDAVSEKGALGLMQVMPATAKEIAADLGMGSFDLKNPQDNQKIGTAYLIKLLKEFGGDIELALTAYHSGPNRVKSLLVRTEGKTLDDIRQYLGPIGQRYASDILKRLNKGKTYAA